MKSKRLIVLLCVLAFITVLIVLNSTLFTLQNIRINWLTSKDKLEQVKDYEMVENIKTGQSIFLLNKKDITKALEKEYPYLQVVSIETQFPNKIVIHSAERISLYAIKLADDKYAILDEKGKVLSLLTDRDLFKESEGKFGTKPIMVTFDGMVLNQEDFVEGEQVKVEKIEKLLTSLSLSLRESRYTPMTSKGVLKTIDVVSAGNFSEIKMQTRSGMRLNIKEIEKFATDKLLLAFDRYNALHNEGIVNCTIEVWHNVTTNQIIAEIK